MISTLSFPLTKSLKFYRLPLVKCSLTSDSSPNMTGINIYINERVAKREVLLGKM